MDFCSSEICSSKSRAVLFHRSGLAWMGGVAEGSNKRKVHADAEEEGSRRWPLVAACQAHFSLSVIFGNDFLS